MKITITEKNFRIDEQGTFAEVVSAFLSAINTMAVMGSGDNKEHLESTYDFLNTMYSSALSSLIPDAELRPDLDEIAILEAQDNIIKAKLKEVEEPEEV